MAYTTTCVESSSGQRGGRDAASFRLICWTTTLRTAFFFFPFKSRM